jgi:integrase
LSPLLKIDYLYNPFLNPHKMANISFFLKTEKQDKNGKAPIVARVTHDNLSLKKHTGEKVKPRFWNKSKQRIRLSKTDRYLNKENRAHQINEFLDSLEDKIKEHFNRCYLNNFTIKESHLRQLLEGKDPGIFREKDFFEAFDEFIEGSKAYKAERTIKGYMTVKNFLFEFQKTLKEPIHFDSIDLSLYDKLQNYAFLEKEKKVNDNYFTKIVAVLKTFLNWAKDRGFYNGEAHKKFRGKEREKDVIYLTLDELMKLFNYPFKLDRHRRARDVYCFGCFTGLRISDILALNKDFIKDNIIYMPIQKTQQIDMIPLNKYALEILERNKDIQIKALPQMSVQKLNKYIKECCREAEIDEPITTTTFYGGQRTQETKPKHELITMHTARKTFVTNSLMLGMNVKAIKDITGHRKDSTFNKYLKIAEQYKQSQMDDTWNNL